MAKTLTLAGDRGSPRLELQVELQHRGGPPVDVRLGVEWSTTMLGGGGNPAAWWDAGEDERVGHDTSGQAEGVWAISQGNDYVGVAVATLLDAPTDAWWAPIETISNSESGFERVYQGSGLPLSWPLVLTPGERWSRTIRQTVSTTRDRAVEESGDGGLIGVPDGAIDGAPLPAAPGATA